MLTADEIRYLWQAADRIGEPFGPLVKLLVLTAARRDELAEMERTELDGDRWTIPGARTKNHRSHTIPLPPLAE